MCFHSKNLQNHDNWRIQWWLSRFHRSTRHWRWKHHHGKSNELQKGLNMVWVLSLSMEKIDWLCLEALMEENELDSVELYNTVKQKNGKWQTSNWVKQNLALDSLQSNLETSFLNCNCSLKFQFQDNFWMSESLSMKNPSNLYPWHHISWVFLQFPNYQLSRFRVNVFSGEIKST